MLAFVNCTFSRNTNRTTFFKCILSSQLQLATSSLWQFLSKAITIKKISFEHIFVFFLLSMNSSQLVNCFYKGILKRTKRNAAENETSVKKNDKIKVKITFAKVSLPPTPTTPTPYLKGTTCYIMQCYKFANTIFGNDNI